MAACVARLFINRQAARKMQTQREEVLENVTHTPCMTIPGQLKPELTRERQVSNCLMQPGMFEHI